MMGQWLETRVGAKVAGARTGALVNLQVEIEENCICRVNKCDENLNCEKVTGFLGKGENTVLSFTRVIRKQKNKATCNSSFVDQISQ